MENWRTMSNLSGAAAAGGGMVLDGYLTRDEAARQLNVSTDTLTRWGTQRIGPPSVRIGRKRYYRLEAVRAWLAAREQPGDIRGRKA